MKTLLCAFTVSLALGCGSKCPEPYYDGSASDEAWRTMQDGEARATADDAKAIQLTFPVEGTSFSATAAPPKFVWSSTLTASLDRPRPLDSARGERRGSWLSRASELVYCSAWAHLPPVTGPIHWLRITAPSQTCPLEVLTTRSEWTPSEEAWAQLKTFTTGTLKLDVFSAYLQETRITEGEYHFTKPLSLTVTK